jgi:hypothetical protein
VANGTPTSIIIPAQRSEMRRLSLEMVRGWRETGILPTIGIFDQRLPQWGKWAAWLGWAVKWWREVEILNNGEHGVPLAECRPPSAGNVLVPKGTRRR